MAIEEAFELVRSEQAIVWAGAGLSLYAGYPNANKLCSIIIKSLSKQHQSFFPKNSRLDTVCEQYVKINGNSKKTLFRILNKEFSKEPKSYEYHTKLSFIPHVKTIITTNYDLLFEKGYDNKIQVIANSNELKYINKKQVQLFKIHGDLNHANELIITESDYANFYNDSIENVYWTTVKERIINNNIIFIGYNFGDINIKTIISSISNQLGVDRKKHFLVAPGFPDHEIEYLRSQNIFYIDSSGENFIDGLIDNLRNNIVNDRKAGIIGLDTFNTFLKNHDLVANFLATQSGHSISEIRSADNQPKFGNLTINSDPVFVSHLNDFMTGKRLEIDFGSNVSKFEMSISGIKILDNTDLLSIKLVRHPAVNTTFDILFDNGFDLRNIPVKIYNTEQRILMEAVFRGKTITLELFGENESLQITFQHDKPYGNPKDELEAFLLLKYIAEGYRFDVFLKNGNKYPGGFTIDGQMSKSVEKYVRYFEMLVEIEKYYKVRFRTIDEITDETFNSVYLLYSNIGGEAIKTEFTTYVEGKIDLETIQNLKNGLVNSNNEISLVFDKVGISVHDQTFIFKKRIFRISDAIIVNLDSLLNDETDVFRVISRTQTATDQFILK